MLLDRRSAPFLAVGAALVVLGLGGGARRPARGARHGARSRVIALGGVPSRRSTGQRTVEDDSKTNVRVPRRTRVPGRSRRLRREGSGVHWPSSGPDT